MSDHDELLPAGGEQQDELWLISYADLLTLLLGFFVLIIASVPLQQSRFEKIAASISGGAPAPLDNLKSRVEELIAAKPELAKSVRVSDDSAGLGIELGDALLFDSGRAEVRAEGRAAVAQLAHLILELPERPVLIEGHTDDMPIHTAQFESNWELSAERAINVLRQLEAGGVPRLRMRASAYADTRMQAQRDRSRRVVIRVE